MSVSTLAAPVFAFAALRSKASGHLLLFEQTWPIREEIIEETHPWFGMKLSELWNNRSRMLIHYLPARGEIDLVSALVGGGCLQKGDRLIIGDRPKVRQKRSFLRKKLVKAIANLPKYQRYLIQTDFVPLYLETKNQTIHGWQLLEAYLQPEDILYLTMPAHRLEQLWRDPPTEKLILK